MVTEAAYIGHRGDKVILKKMKEVDLEQGKIEIETVDDNFEEISIGNDSRFQQFMKIMAHNPQSNEMSIRVMVNEANPKAPEIIDFDFFFREQ